MATAPKYVGRLVGLGALALGAGIGWVGLQAVSNAPGGENSELVMVRAEIVGELESDRNPGLYTPVYELTGEDGAAVRCEGGIYSSDRARVGRSERLAVAGDTPLSACSIVWGAGGPLSAWFIFGVGAAFALMGAAFIIKPPKNMGGGSHGGPF